MAPQSMRSNGIYADYEKMAAEGGHRSQGASVCNSFVKSMEMERLLCRIYYDATHNRCFRRPRTSVSVSPSVGRLVGQSVGWSSDHCSVHWSVCQSTIAPAGLYNGIERSFLHCFMAQIFKMTEK